MTTNSIPRPSAGEGLHTYGLAGISLQQAAERRNLSAPHQGTIDRGPGMLHRMRQLAGDTMIRIGASIAGEAATPIAPRSISPRADMA